MREFNLLIVTELPPGEGSGFLSPPTWTSPVELFFMNALHYQRCWLSLIFLILQSLALLESWPECESLFLPINGEYYFSSSKVDCHTPKF